LLHSEAIELLKEIAITNPEILQSAVYINLHLNDKAQTSIIIHSCFSIDELELLEHLVNRRNLTIGEDSNDVWVIF
jgi:hypothetical protein